MRLKPVYKRGMRDLSVIWLKLYCLKTNLFALNVGVYGVVQATKDWLKRTREYLQEHSFRVLVLSDIRRRMGNAIKG